MKTHEYCFDVKLFSTLRIRATSLKNAREMLAGHLDCASANFGMTEDGQLLLGEASVDGEPCLVEFDGEPL